MKRFSYGKSKKSDRKNKRRITIFVVLLFLMSCFIYYFNVVCPIVISLSEEKIRSVSTSAISTVVGNVMGGGEFDYVDLVKLSYSSNNQIEAIEVDTIVVNNIIRQVTKGVQDKFDILGEEGIKIALGTFTGVPFLYGIGPEVSVKLVPVGTISTKIHSSLNSAGINQSLHRLYFTISANLGMILPAQTKNFITELDILLCENVIIGQIPSVFFQNNLI